MPYTLQNNEILSDAVKRIAHEQTDRALHHLRTGEPEINKAVHESRKALKQLRALLRLLRDEIGDDVYQRENAAYRDAGQLLSDLRDSFAIIEILDDVIKKLKDKTVTKASSNIRERLVERHERIRREVIDESDAMQQAIEQIEAAKERIDSWPIKHNDFSALADGLHRVYGRGIERMAEAYDNPHDIERFHEWRKRVKYLWYHVTILQPLWPPILDGYAAQLKELSDYLGDAHDYAVLYDTIAPFPETDSGGGRKLLALLDYHQAQLEVKAQPLGQLIYAEGVDEFVARMEGYWQVWQNVQDLPLHGS